MNDSAAITQNNARRAPRVVPSANGVAMTIAQVVATNPQAHTVKCRRVVMPKTAT